MNEEAEKDTLFKKELAELINKHSMENDSNTPDFILADYLWRCLNVFSYMTERRDKWYGVHLEPTNKYFENKEEQK